MDRKIKQHEKGFTLVELMIVIVIVGIISAAVITNKNHAQAINAVNNDLHSISAFLKKLRLDSFTSKASIQVTVGATQLTTQVTDQTGAVTPGPSIILQNNFLVTGSPFTISTRGNFTTGNIRLDYGVPNPPPTGTKYSCLVIDNIRIRLGEINAGGCDAR